MAHQKDGWEQADCPLYIVSGCHYRGTTNREFQWYLRRGLALTGRIPKPGDLVIVEARQHWDLVVVTKVTKSEEYTYDQYKAALAADPGLQPSCEVMRCCDRVEGYQLISHPGVIAEFVPYTPASVKAMAHDLGYDKELTDGEARSIMFRAAKKMLKGGSYKRIRHMIQTEAANCLANVLGLPPVEDGGHSGRKEGGTARKGGKGREGGHGRPRQQKGGRRQGGHGRPRQQNGGNRRGANFPDDRPLGGRGQTRVVTPSRQAPSDPIGRWLYDNPAFRTRLNASVAKMARDHVDVSGMTRKDVLVRAVRMAGPRDLPCSEERLADYLLKQAR